MTADTQQENGEFTFDAGPVMVKFGPESHQEVNLTTAERMLSWLVSAQPATFTKALSHAMIGDK